MQNISKLASKRFELNHFIPAEVPTGCNQFVFARTGEPD
jgi:hypothetical protein